MNGRRTGWWRRGHEWPAHGAPEAEASARFAWERVGLEENGEEQQAARQDFAEEEEGDAEV